MASKTSSNSEKMAPNKSVKVKPYTKKTPKSSRENKQRSLTPPPMTRSSESATSTDDNATMPDKFEYLNRMKLDKNQYYNVRKSKQNVGQFNGSVLKEIRQLQKSTKLLIPRKPFTRLVREITQNFHSDYRYRKEAFHALQESTEDYIVEFFSKSFDITANRMGKTLQAKDMSMLESILNENLA